MSFKCTGALQIGNLRFLTEGGRFRSQFTAPAGVGDLVRIVRCVPVWAQPGAGAGKLDDVRSGPTPPRRDKHAFN